MSKILVAGGVAVNIMSMAMLRMIGKGPKDLIKTNVILKDFEGDTSEPKGVLNVELTIGSEMVPTSFFVINEKGSYKVLLGRNWIHTNYCILSMMHQILIQRKGDEIEIVPADTIVNVETTDLNIW
jgi:hypothetical protein